jgi:hypothetical protein
MPSRKTSSGSRRRPATKRAVQRKAVEPKAAKATGDTSTTLLQGWKQIAKFLGQPMNVAQRWSRSGMPVRREGRFTVAAPDELSQWLGRESGAAQPVHIATGSDTDLAAELRKSLSAAKHGRAGTRK